MAYLDGFVVPVPRNRSADDCAMSNAMMTLGAHVVPCQGLRRRYAQTSSVWNGPVTPGSDGLEMML